MNQNLLKRCVAEAVGTFFLVFVGTSAIAANNLSNGALGHLGIAMSFGLALIVAILTLGHISGAHFNPAVSLGLTVTGHFPARELPFYWLFQVIGAVVSSIFVVILYGQPRVALGVNHPNAEFGVVNAFILEIVLTFFLVTAVKGAATDKRGVGTLAGIAIGLVVLFDAISNGPASGASMNPARSIGPALIALDFNDLWIYLIAPLIGGVLASLLYEYMRGGGGPEPEHAPPTT